MIAFLFYLSFLFLFVILAVYAERKVSAFMQDRVGPMVAGKYGILQTLADVLKMLQKEDIKPYAIDKKLFLFAPFVIFASVFAGFAVLPLTSGIRGSAAETGIYFLLGVVSLDVVGILMAGWGSNSKFSLFGAMRSVAQIMSYEIPLGLAVLCVIMVAQTLDLQEISFQQGIFNDNNLVENGTITSLGGVLSWNIFRHPFLIIAFVIYFIASLAESNRTPFDLPESESELIGGFQTEYSGFRWAIIMLAEYGMMLLVSILGVVLFLGSWNTPFPNVAGLPLAQWTSGEPGTFSGHAWGVFWLISKSMILIYVQMWVRWTLPRVRVDQMMNISWKYLTPIGLGLVFIAGIWKLWVL